MVSSISADVIFLVIGRSCSANVCCVDSILAYFRMFIDAEASARFLPIGDTSSSTNVQSLSSISCVRGSLKSVTVMAWLSGTGQLMLPTSGSTMSGFQPSEPETTRRDLRVHTTYRLDGRLQVKEALIGSSRYRRKLSSSYHFDVVSTFISW